MREYGFCLYTAVLDVCNRLGRTDLAECKQFAKPGQRQITMGMWPKTQRSAVGNDWESLDSAVVTVCSTQGVLDLFCPMVKSVSGQQWRSGYRASLG
jgi:hypothetical protein